MMTGVNKWWWRIGIGGVSLICLALAGCWDGQSSRYWRCIAQGSLLYGASEAVQRKSTAQYTLKLVAAAIRVHRAGVTDIELQTAANALEQAGAKVTASSLWMGLANVAAENQQTDQARSHAERAFKADRRVQALEALFMLNAGQPDVQERWIDIMAFASPGHELIHTWSCKKQLSTFAWDPPHICKAPEWLSELAWRGRREEQRIAQELADLPARRGREIADRQAEIQGIEVAQPRLRDEYAALKERRGNLGWRAIGEFLIEVLPLPKDDDTLETWVSREGICAFWAIRWLCRGDAAKQAFERMQQARATIDSRLSEISSRYRANADRQATLSTQIDYWNSSGPYDSLVNERTALLPVFVRQVDAEVRSRYSQVGIPVQQAINAVMAAADAE